jgi:hypothetical protein
MQAHRLGAGAEGRRGCPGSEALALAASGELRERQRDELADHLGACRDCAEEYQLLTPLLTWAADATRSLGHKPPPGARAPGSGSFALPHALAASLLVACLGLTAWNLALRGEGGQLAQQLAARREEIDQARAEAGRLARLLAALEQPQLNVPIVDLESDRARGADTAATRVELSQEAAALTAILHGSSNREFPVYSVALVDAHRRVLWQGTGLRRNSDGTFTLVLPGRLLAAGEYWLRISGGDATGPILDEYPLTIRRR